ncbi:MAG: hypothetical protein EHM39_11605 [Chloroflexi bacterium]|nr:MAG: hypothetical protein EHM39_11605 [Chloroflexota bacterium]
MITRKHVSAKLLAYFNNAITLADLVNWAENSLVEGGFGPDDDTDMLMDIVIYLAGSDTQYFPLTWEMCQDFMQRLGTPVKVIAVSAA